MKDGEALRGHGSTVAAAKVLAETGLDEYRSEDGHVMRREEGTTPNGNPISGRWVLRAPGGEWLDFDKYRSDLAERNGFKLC